MTAARAVEVLESGALTVVQDRGRPGYAHLGVGRSGAADLGSHDLANRLVGNPPDAASFEVTNGGLALRPNHATWMALTGAPAPVRAGGRSHWSGAAFPVGAGETVELGVPARGLRSYLAVRGGLDSVSVLGSRSTDIMAAIGPPRVTAGQVIDVGRTALAMPGVDLAVTPSPSSASIELPTVPGPRADWFLPEALVRLFSEDFLVTADANRVGVRLDGPSLPRRHREELASEGVVTGSLQAPPGRLTLFLADHPVTGGYPVIAVVLPEGVDRAAQARPGQVVRFVPS